MRRRRLRWLFSAFVLGALATWLWVTLFRRRQREQRRERRAMGNLTLRPVPVSEPPTDLEPAAASARFPTTAVVEPTAPFEWAVPVEATVPVEPEEPVMAPRPATVPEAPTSPPVLSPTELRERDASDETPFAAACPQHLSDVKGIGSVFETRLYEAGVGSFWELSQLADQDLARILRMTELQSRQMDLDAIREDALRLATETKSKGRQWTKQSPDDFEPLQGIGPTFEKRLYDAGICTYDALANATVELLEDVCHAPARFKPDYQAWIDQAKALVAARNAQS